MEYIITIISAFLFGNCILLVGTQNPIHSILLLILVFFMGSVLFFFLNVEYFALLFLIVYVGAIVVLFLFIVMMLEIKMVNFSERIKDLFSYQNLILAFLLVEILNFANEDFAKVSLFWNLFQKEDLLAFFSEANLFIDYSKVIQRTDHLRAIGGVLFLEFQTGVILAGLLLFLSMIGSIVMTLEGVDNITKKTVKTQDANHQSVRTSFI